MRKQKEDYRVKQATEPYKEKVLAYYRAIQKRKRVEKKKNDLRKTRLYHYGDRAHDKQL